MIEPSSEAGRSSPSPRDPTVRAEEFTYRSARSGSLLAGLGLAILVETVALHLWLARRHPMLAWLLTASSVAALVWLALDYRAMGAGAVRLSAETLELRIGRRFALRVPRADVQSALRPGWRDVPETGSPAAAGYFDLTKPASPNVLITLATPATFRLSVGLRRSVRRVGLHLDEPESFLAALGVPSATTDAAAGSASAGASIG